MTEPSEENLRIRSYLQSQAAKLAVPELIAKVRIDSEQLRAAAESASTIDHTRRPADGGWSVNEVLGHVHESCRGINAGILAAAKRGEQPARATDSITESHESRAPLGWLAAIAEEREQLFAGLAEVSGEEHLQIRWSHPFFGDLNWREWLLFLRLHDLDHARQITATVEALRSA
jgi:hypothetical protein